MSLRVAYQEGNAETWLSGHEDVLAVFEFCRSPLDAGEPRHVPVALQQLIAEQVVDHAGQHFALLRAHTGTRLGRIPGSKRLAQLAEEVLVRGRLGRLAHPGRRGRAVGVVDEDNVQVAVVVQFAAAEDWPQFRGPGGKGVSDDGSAPTE